MKLYWKAIPRLSPFPTSLLSRDAVLLFSCSHSSFPGHHRCQRAGVHQDPGWPWSVRCPFLDLCCAGLAQKNKRIRSDRMPCVWNNSLKMVLAVQSPAHRAMENMPSTYQHFSLIRYMKLPPFFFFLMLSEELSNLKSLISLSALALQFYSDLKTLFSLWAISVCYCFWITVKPFMPAEQSATAQPFKKNRHQVER